MLSDCFGSQCDRPVCQKVDSHNTAFDPRHTFVNDHYRPKVDIRILLIFALLHIGRQSGFIMIMLWQSKQIMANNGLSKNTKVQTKYLKINLIAKSV